MSDEKEYSSDKKKPETRYIPVENSQVMQDDEIDLVELIMAIWDGRKILIVCISIFFALGLFHFLFGPTEYESEAILIQESQGQVSQSQQLLQQFISGGGSQTIRSDMIQPTLYPMIVESAEFQYGLMFEEVDFDTYNTRMSLYEYFNNYYEPSFREKVYSAAVDYTIKLPLTLYRNVFSSGAQLDGHNELETVEIDERLLVQSPGERRVIGQMRSRINIERGALISIKTRLPDPRAAAQTNAILLERLQEFVTDYRIEKARQNLNFVQLQREEARARYEEAQRRLAEFSDRNIRLTSAVAQTELEHLQNERNLTFNVYNSISQQVEQARLILQEETPVFTVLQKPNLPTSKTSSSTQIIVLSLFLGGVIGVFWIFGRKAYHIFIHRIISN